VIGLIEVLKDAVERSREVGGKLVVRSSEGESEKVPFIRGRNLVILDSLDQLLYV